MPASYDQQSRVASFFRNANKISLVTPSRQKGSPLNIVLSTLLASGILLGTSAPAQSAFEATSNTLAAATIAVREATAAPLPSHLETLSGVMRGSKVVVLSTPLEEPATLYSFLASEEGMRTISKAGVKTLVLEAPPEMQSVADTYLKGKMKDADFAKQFHGFLAEKAPELAPQLIPYAVAVTKTLSRARAQGLGVVFVDPSSDMVPATHPAVTAFSEGVDNFMISKFKENPEALLKFQKLGAQEQLLIYGMAQKEYFNSLPEAKQKEIIEGFAFIEKENQKSKQAMQQKLTQNVTALSAKGPVLVALNDDYDNFKDTIPNVRRIDLYQSADQMNAAMKGAIYGIKQKPNYIYIPQSGDTYSLDKGTFAKPNKLLMVRFEAPTKKYQGPTFA